MNPNYNPKVEEANRLAQAGTVGGAQTSTGEIIGGSYTPNNQPINTKTLSSSQPPLSIPTIPPSTGATGFSGEISAMVEQSKLQQAQEQKIKEAQASVSEEKKGITGLMEKYIGIQSSRPDAEREAGLDVKAQRVTNYTNQLEGLERAEQNETKAILGRGDITKEAQQGLISNIQRDYAFRKADVALLQSAANRDYQTAFNILDRKIQLQLEPLKTQLEFTKMFYDDNKQLLSKEEDRAFNLKVKQLENQYETEKADKKAVADIQLKLIEKGIAAPAGLSTAKNQQEAINILNKSGINLAGGEAGTDAPLYVGLNSATATAVRQQVSSFKSEKAVTNFQTIQEGKDFVNSLSDKTTNPAEDQALIYALAKSLDPDSVVREGEYATAQKYAQSWVQAYGNSIKQALNGTGFLSETARKNIKSVINTKYDSAKKSYDNVYKEYTNGINNLTGRKDGEKFLRSYSTESSEEPLSFEADGVIYTKAEDGLYYPDEIAQIKKTFISELQNRVANNKSQVSEPVPKATPPLINFGTPSTSTLSFFNLFRQ